MKSLKYSLILMLMITFMGCEKSFEELEVDSNRPVSVPASLVLQSVQYDMYNNTGRAFSAEMRWNQFYCSNYNYYATNEYQWSEMPNHFFSLKNVIKMEEEARKAGLEAVNPYSAVAKFYKAFLYDQMTKRVGDLPLSEGLQGITVLNPKYDTQKQVYIQILKWLEESNADLSSLITKGNQTLTGDIYYGGDLKKWQKAVNVFHLRMLIQLSKKEADADLAVKSKFAAIISNPVKYPLISSLGESLQFISNQYNKFPSNPDNFGFDATRQNMSRAYIERLTERNDPRVMVTCEPAGSQLKAGKLPSDFSSYVGASSGEDLADMSSKAGTSNGADFAPGQYSFQNRKRYYTNYVGEPTFLVGYPEMCFNIAEGLHRNWASGSASQWYENGIKASMDFYGIKNGSNTMTYSRNGSKEASDARTFNIDFNLNDYLAQANVKYEAGNAGLEKILTQKYLAFFMNSGMEAYFNWRRTGYPTFYTGVGTGNSGRIALRWIYPLSERTTNSANYKTAIDAQFAGKDDINDLIWLLK
ncbi:SusD/RagB family nutrient-binding outer membrane lipoprotein [Daejeonella sp. H1SJ63]|uniref:SusD/RagB family nutrient-binding outer membrane lipoprotein n=1 Tax=Daejeonella sp. H1SJ63 TaxID=3034145 RepID=UPI0023EDA6D4|nr:SusD/RagB family nutrient-binding outer membrane lipoprotein [Daejeonella sp. H1SJ63]